MRRARLVLLLVGAVLPRSLLLAQWQAGASVGASRLKQGALAEANAATVGVNVDRGGDYTAFRVAGLGSRAGAGRLTGQALAIGSATTPPWKLFSVQAVGAVGAFGQSRDTPTISADAATQLRVGDASRALTLGVGTGRSRYRGFDFSRNFFDGALSWYHERDGLSLNGAIGWRAQEGARGAGWHAVDATAWLSARAGVNVSIGRSADDLVRGVPSARYVTASLRLSTAPHVSIFRRPLAGPRITATRDAGDARIIVMGVTATHVEIMADFTQWEPVPLVRDGTAWRLERAIPPGLHRVALRIDGGEWIVPRNLATSTDELIGPVGLLNVP